MTGDTWDDARRLSVPLDAYAAARAGGTPPTSLEYLAALHRAGWPRITLAGARAIADQRGLVLSDWTAARRKV